jgi:hypothetical protein
LRSQAFDSQLYQVEAAYLTLVANVVVTAVAATKGKSTYQDGFDFPRGHRRCFDS